MARYSGFIGQTGGSGGEGSYAIIKILYDEGEKVIVEHNGETYEAPDTSGIWMFGCEENGTYVCSLIDALIPQSTTITITEKGQVEFVNLETQIINYIDLYYFGTISSLLGGMTSRYYSSAGEFSSNNDVDLRDYTGFYTLQNVDSSNNRANTSNVSLSLSGNTIISSISSPSVTSYLKTNKISYYRSSYSFNKKIVIRLTISGNTIEYSYNVAINPSCLTFEMYHQTLSQYGIFNNVYGLGATKNDDISIMSAYGSTINDILANSVNLFNDELILQKMVKTCTGDFMFSALGNQTFINAMNNSENKTILLANEHWAKFISFLSI